MPRPVGKLIENQHTKTDQLESASLEEHQHLNGKLLIGTVVVVVGGNAQLQQVDIRLSMNWLCSESSKFVKQDVSSPDNGQVPAPNSGKALVNGSVIMKSDDDERRLVMRDTAFCDVLQKYLYDLSPKAKTE